MKLIFLSLLLPILALAKELEACYKVYFWFLPVAESCVLYIKDKESVKIKSWAKTVAVARFVKPVNSWGEVELIGLKPKSFSLFQREGSYVRDHFYLFDVKGVRYRIVRHKREGKDVKEGFFESSVFLLDPFSASLLIYIDTPNFRKETLFVFYDEKLQEINYRTIGEESVEVFGNRYEAWKVLLVPRFETKGLLKPKGKWFVWVDKDTNIPVKLKVVFTIGSAEVYLKEVKGHRKLLLEVATFEE